MMNENRGRFVAVTNQKGGVGKTTTVINLGAALAKGGLKCLIIDMDPQGNASTGLGSYAPDRTATIYEAMTKAVPLADTIVSTPIEGLDLIPGSTDLSGLDIELTSAEDRATRLRTLLEDGAAQSIRSRYDCVLIDCPPALNLLTVNALAAVDRIVIPLQAEFFALEGVTQLLSTIRQIQSSVNQRLSIAGIVLTMVDNRNRLSRQVADDVRENLSDIVFETTIPRNVRLSEAPSHGLPALVYDPDCAGSQAYLHLAVEFLQKESAYQS